MVFRRFRQYDASQGPESQTKRTQLYTLELEDREMNVIEGYGLLID